jgi:hypothetical protein
MIGRIGRWLAWRATGLLRRSSYDWANPERIKRIAEEPSALLADMPWRASTGPLVFERTYLPNSDVTQPDPYAWHDTRELCGQ